MHIATVNAQPCSHVPYILRNCAYTTCLCLLSAAVLLGSSRRDPAAMQGPTTASLGPSVHSVAEAAQLLTAADVTLLRGSRPAATVAEGARGSPVCHA
jgi:hypothetical protein